MSNLAFQACSVHLETLPKLGFKASSWCWLVARAPEEVLVDALLRKFSNTNGQQHEQAAAT